MLIGYYRYFYKLTSLAGALFIFYALAGCADHYESDSKSDHGNEYLIRVGDRVTRVLDFNNAFEIVKTAYPHKVMRDPASFREAQLRFLNQITEEMILLERAKELHIRISDSEVKKAIADIKSDYPEGVFEEMLLEYAVSYHSWKERLKLRLLMEKVVASQMEEQIAITPEDISEYYKKHYKGGGLTSDLKDTSDKSKEMNEIIIRQLRREKAEEAYKLWIKNLKKKYTIEINKAQWEKIAGA